MTRPKVLIARAVFPQTLERLRAQLDVTPNQEDVLWSPQELAERLRGHVGVLTTGSERVDAGILQRNPQLRICANMAVGYNNLDIPALTQAGVLATNTPDVLTETTADFAFALVLATARRLTESEHFLRAGLWQRWRYDLFAGVDVFGSTLGILGMGRIGQAIARRGAHGFGMKVLYHNRSRLDEASERAVGARWVSKTELLQQSDHLVLALPYSASAHHIIGADELALMKPTATLVNVARGGVVDDAALAQALQQGRLAGAGLDVFEGEPTVHRDLLACTRVVLTPHIASATQKTRQAMADLAADNLIAFLTRGQALTPVNPEVLRAAPSAG